PSPTPQSPAPRRADKRTHATSSAQTPNYPTNPAPASAIAAPKPSSGMESFPSVGSVPLSAPIGPSGGFDAPAANAPNQGGGLRGDGMEAGSRSTAARGGVPRSVPDATDLGALDTTG